MSLDLPVPLSNYFQAKNAHDVEAMLAVFSADASVRDEKQDMVGRTAIRDWLETTTRKYRVAVKPTAIGHAGGRAVVTAQVSGTFPGSPVELNFRFAIVGEKISSLEID